MPFHGYYRRNVPAPDHELTQVGPGTPGGEYLRRFWQPVAFARDLTMTPRRVRIMSEDLVVFRDRSGRVNLPCPGSSHPGVQPIDGSAVRRGEIDAQQRRFAARMQGENVAIGAAAAQVDRAVAFGDDSQAPDVGVEARVRGDVGHAQIDAAQTLDISGEQVRPFRFKKRMVH